MLNRPLPQRLISLLGGGLLLAAVAGFVLLVLRPAFLPEGAVQAPLDLAALDLAALEQPPPRPRSAATISILKARWWRPAPPSSCSRA